MLNQPMKLLIIVAVAAVLGSSFLAQNFNKGVVPESRASAPVNQSPSPAPGVSRSWYSRWFEGMSFRTGGDTPRSAPASAPSPARPQQQSRASGFGQVSIAADRGGQYNSQVEIGGQVIPMLVDTGATVVALRHEDAQRLGIMPMPSDYTVKIATANGSISAARTNLREVRVENILVNDVAAVVMPEGALHKSLLGMSFLRKLARFEVAAGNLVLQP